MKKSWTLDIVGFLGGQEIRLTGASSSEAATSPSIANTANTSKMEMAVHSEMVVAASGMVAGMASEMAVARGSIHASARGVERSTQHCTTAVSTSMRKMLRDLTWLKPRRHAADA
jgi:hypothetical protein